MLYFSFSLQSRLHLYLRRLDTTQHLSGLDMEATAGRGMRTENILIKKYCGYKGKERSVVINERLTCIWQKHCLNLTYGERVCVQAGKKEVDVYCFVYQELPFSENSILFLLEGIFLLPSQSSECCQPQCSIPEVIQIRVLPQNMLNWKCGMKKKISGDKTKHMLYSAANSHVARHLRELCFKESS